MPYIELSGKRGKGLRTLVDEDTYKKYAHLPWHLSDTGYAVRRTREGTIRLHRLVANTPEGLVTDHKNHDRLDNRSSNLRVVTHKDNMGNLRSKGYTWDASRGKWMVRYRSMFYGRYDTQQEAIAASQDARSGKPKQSKVLPRRTYLKPGINYMLPMARSGRPPYYIRPVVDGKRKFIGYFRTAQDAEAALNKVLGKEK